MTPLSASGDIHSAQGPPRTGRADRTCPADKNRPVGVGVRRLTALDVRILEGVAVGVSTVRLAASLYLSRQGVEYRIGLMLRRFQAANRAALVSRAHSLGVLSVGAWPPRVVPEFLEPQEEKGDG
ncbi:helix-turn-helix transcriptional regulator [Streptomyces uncialis]|uniref:helix-turn-helix transcriptional regulator n=1 Tax=Streptomyces uncialis TaxID=1048205 RepID=UPI00382CF4D4